VAGTADCGPPACADYGLPEESSRAERARSTVVDTKQHGTQSRESTMVVEPRAAGVITMKSIHAVWKNGQIVPTQPVDWPDGTELAVEPLEQPIETDPEADLLGDDDASIARWLAWFDSLEPLSFTPEEEAAWQAARHERRDWEKSRFNERAERLKGIFE
jgi:hypothetical protein